MKRAAIRAVFALAAVLSFAAAAQGWTPQRHVELVAPNAPGGSTDATARVVHRLWQEMKLLPVSSGVVNRSGAEHAIAYNYLSQRAGDAHYLGIASPVLLSNHIAGRLSVTYTDLTPVAMMMTEYYIFVVRADSALKSGRDMVDALRRKPDALTLSVATVLTRIATGLVLRSAGIDHKPVRMVVLEGGKHVPALLGGHVDVSLGPLVQFLPHIESGALRAIAVSAPKRMGGVLAAVPTWAEQGYEGAAYETWRAVIAPKGLAPAQIAYWEDVLRKVAESEDFRRNAEKTQAEAIFRGAAESRRQMETEYEQARGVMAYLGMIK